MYLFITIIFIAELIIAATLITLIIKADNKVKKCSAEVLKFKPCCEKMLKEFSFCVNSFGEYYQCIIDSMKRKQRKFRINMLKNLAMYLSLFLLKGKYKRVAAFLQFAVLFYDYWVKVHKT